jgi:histidyl-tRNA synthetase
MAAIQTVKGFRDFFPEACAKRNYIQSVWTSVARRYGFVEYETPVLENTELYKKKSGQEIVQQLFYFEDKAGREVAMRPEVTPGLARMITARQMGYKKPMKWFQMGSCFRYEEPQEGRSREFIQFNADIIGDGSGAADAELVGLAIDLMREFGFTEEDVVVRLSNRQIWVEYMERLGLDELQQSVLMQVVDKLERVKPEVSEARLKEIGLSLVELKLFMTEITAAHPVFAELRMNLEARGLWSFVKIDASIVRGLAYYTGCVFEVFDLKYDLRALAGGGRYDQLNALMSDGHVDLPSVGFGMGDVVVGLLLDRCADAKLKMDNAVTNALGCDVYVALADEGKRFEALKLIQQLRDDLRLKVEYSMQPLKLNKQFQMAEYLKAKWAIVVGSEYPELQVKKLSTRESRTVNLSEIAETLR